MRLGQITRALAHLVTVAMALAACDGTSASPDASVPVDASLACEPLSRPTGLTTIAGELGRTSEPIAIDTFCAAYSRALCEAPAGCGCATDPPINCLRYARTRCESAGGPLGPEMRAAIDAGTIVYDDVAAGRAIQALHDASASCAVQPHTVEIEFLLAATEALHGDVAVGGSCDPVLPFACVAGAWCADAGDSTFACRDASPSEGPCAAFGVCESPGAWTLGCDGDPCDRGLAPGDPCPAADPRSCATVCTADACACPVALGGACSVDAECDSGDCIDGTCGAPAAHLGDACATDQACIEGTCAGGECRSWQCGGGWY